jgi:hypothetical protein
MTEEEYWATDPSFSDESLDALADAGDYLLGEIGTDRRPRYNDYEIFEMIASLSHKTLFGVRIRGKNVGLCFDTWATANQWIRDQIENRP